MGGRGSAGKSAGGALSFSGATNIVGSPYVGSLAYSGSDGSSGVLYPSSGTPVTVCPTSGTTVYFVPAFTAAYTRISGQTFTFKPQGFRP